MVSEIKKYTYKKKWVKIKQMENGNMLFFVFFLYLTKRFCLNMFVCCRNEILKEEIKVVYRPRANFFIVLQNKAFI